MTAKWVKTKITDIKAGDLVKDPDNGKLWAVTGVKKSGTITTLRNPRPLSFSPAHEGSYTNHNKTSLMIMPGAAKDQLAKHKEAKAQQKVKDAADVAEQKAAKERWAQTSRSLDEWAKPKPTTMAAHGVAMSGDSSVHASGSAGGPSVQPHHTAAHAAVLTRTSAPVAQPHQTAAHQAAINHEPTQSGPKGGTFHTTASGKKSYSKR